MTTPCLLSTSTMREGRPSLMPPPCAASPAGSCRPRSARCSAGCSEHGGLSPCSKDLGQAERTGASETGGKSTEARWVAYPRGAEQAAELRPRRRGRGEGEGKHRLLAVNTPCAGSGFLIKTLPPPRHYPVRTMAIPHARVSLGSGVLRDSKPL